MQDKQKVTLYLPPELHRQLKIRAAVSSEAMSALAEKALIFYLSHPEVVEHFEEGHGHTHQVYNCPECSTSVVVRDSELVALGRQLEAIVDGEISVERVQRVSAASNHQGEEELVPC
jgi:plasmid stability protein